MTGEASGCKTEEVQGKLSYGAVFSSCLKRSNSSLLTFFCVKYRKLVRFLKYLLQVGQCPFIFVFWFYPFMSIVPFCYAGNLPAGLFFQVIQLCSKALRLLVESSWFLPCIPSSVQKPYSLLVLLSVLCFALCHKTFLHKSICVGEGDQQKYFIQLL